MWYDVKDENDVWRVGYCKQPNKEPRIVALDGFHPSYSAYYCKHSERIEGIRVKTMGLTVPSDRTLRELLKEGQFSRVCQNVFQLNGMLTLYLMKQNFMDMTAVDIMTHVRTEFLILVDTIFGTPYQILNQIQMVELIINKIFINIVNFYLRLLEQSKKHIKEIKKNQVARQLYLSTYQIGILTSMIMGMQKRSRPFYLNKANIFTRSDGFIDCFLKSDGLRLIRHLLKDAKFIESLTVQDVQVSLQSIYIFLELFQKSQKDFSQYKTEFTLVMDEVVDYLRIVVDTNQHILTMIVENAALISRVQTHHIRLKPNRQFSIRKYLQNKKNPPLQYGKIRHLQQRMKKLQSMLSSVAPQSSIQLPEQPLKQPTHNFGEEAFLASIEWALQEGDIAACKKMVQWRKSLLKLGRIAGWEVAAAVGKKTNRKMEIGYDDIIEANLEYLHRQCISE